MLPTTLDQQKETGRSGSPITLSCTNIVKSHLSCSTQHAFMKTVT